MIYCQLTRGNINGRLNVISSFGKKLFIDNPAKWARNNQGRERIISLTIINAQNVFTAKATICYLAPLGRNKI